MLMSVAVLTLLGLALGYGLSFAAKKFAVEESPLAQEIEAMLPASNCGQCGFPGCQQAAVALSEGNASVTCCPPGGQALAEKLAARLGVSLEGEGFSAPLIAAVNPELCTGCTRCFKACPTSAIVGATKQLHTVFKEACTGCGKCSEACPENCISLSPEAANLSNWHWEKPAAAANQ